VLTRSIEPLVEGIRVGAIGTGIAGLLAAAAHFLRRRF
jgi:hypothetical protein